MSYKFTNSRGITYYLNTKEVTLRGDRKSNIYYFSKDERDTACDLPDGYVVKENERTGLPLAGKDKNQAPF